MSRPAHIAFALDNEALLHACDPKWIGSKTELATHLQRDQSNTSKTLKRAEELGLIEDLALTTAGTKALYGLARALDDGSAGAATAGVAELPPGFAFLTHRQIEPDPLNPRKFLASDVEGIAELAESIAQDGLLENLVVRANPMASVEGAETLHRLIAGERRHRAIGLLIDDKRWPKDRPILCVVKDIDDAAHRRLALVENLQRKDLRPIDEATALKELMAVTGQTTADVAAEIGFTQRFVQQRLQLLELPAELKVRMNNGELSIERGREAAAMWPKLPPIKQVELREGKITVEACRKWLSDQPEEIVYDDDQLLILAEVAWAVSAKPAGYWSNTPCDYRVDGLPRQMEKAGLLRIGEAYYGPEKGQREVGLTQAAFQQIRRMCGADEQLNRTALEPLLRRARSKVLSGNPLSATYRPDAFKDVDRLFKEKRYVSTWLNKPFEIDPAVKARAAEAKREETARNKKWADQEKAEKAKREAAQAQGAVVLEQATALCAALAARPAEVMAQGAAALFLEITSPLPWRTDPKDGAIRDVAGDVVFQGRYYDFGGRFLAERRLVCALVNLAAGAAFEAPDAPPPALTRENFLTRVAAALLEVEDETGDSVFPDMAVATQAAGVALDAYLGANDLTFADPEEDWDLIVDDIVEQACVAAETAQAAVADAGAPPEAETPAGEPDDTPEYLQRLAGAAPAAAQPTHPPIPAARPGRR